MQPKFSMSAFKTLPDDRARNELCAELGAALTIRMGQARAFAAEARACIEELRALGHDLWSFDENDEVQLWCSNYETPTGPGIVVTISVPAEVTVEWSAQ